MVVIRGADNLTSGLKIVMVRCHSKWPVQHSIFQMY